jgi:hypothetical protein
VTRGPGALAAALEFQLQFEAELAGEVGPPNELGSSVATRTLGYVLQSRSLASNSALTGGADSAPDGRALPREEFSFCRAALGLFKLRPYLRR